MQHFKVAILCSFLGLTSTNFAMDVDQPRESEFVAPEAAEFNPDDAWSDMLNFAETRAKWHKDVIDLLRNQTLDLKERLALAKKINPEMDEEKIAAPHSFKEKRKLEFQTKTAVNTIAADMLYSFLFWDFLERTLKFYTTEPNATPEIRRALLPHLASEIVNFDFYASGDLIRITELNERLAKEHQSDFFAVKCGYVTKEFYFNRAIHKECQALANHYGISIANVMQVEDGKGGTCDLALEEIDTLGKVGADKDILKASKNDASFFEQVLFYRRGLIDSNQIPDINQGKLAEFHRYILPVTGAVFLREAAKAPTAPQGKSSFLPPEPPRKVVKKQAKKAAQQATPKTLDSSAYNAKKEAKLPEEMNRDQRSKKPGSQAVAPMTTTAVAIASPQSAQPVKVVAPLAIQSVPVLARKITFKDVRCRVKTGTSLSYLVGKKVFEFPFKEENPACFNPIFLDKIKRMTNLAPGTDKLPNIALGAITLHYQMAGKELTKIVKFGELFLSGGKHFGNEGLWFKDDNKLVNAMHNMLTLKEKTEISKLPNEERRVPLGIAMEKRLRREIIEGAWFANSVDSEAIFLLCLVKKLPNILSDLIGRAEQPITLTHAVISISSYRDACSNCERLIQGFQWRLGDIIQGFRIPGIQLDDSFGTLAIVRGHVRGKFSHENKHPTLEHEPIRLVKSSHPLVCVPVDK